MNGARLDAGGNCLKSERCLELFFVKREGLWWRRGGAKGWTRSIIKHCATKDSQLMNETQSPPNKSTCTGPKQSAVHAFGRLVWSMMLSTLQMPEKQASSTIETSSSSSTFRLSSSTTACICFVKSSFVLNSLSNLNSFSFLFCF